MTQNQIAYQVHLENVRSHLATEAETSRSNQAREKETQRSNLANEAENIRYHTGTMTETNRHNVATEEETKRHNLFGETLETNKLAEQIRSNKVREEETHRSNLQQESIGRANAQAQQLRGLAAVQTAATSANRLERETPLIMAQVGESTQKAINFGSSTKLNLQRVNESRANTQYTDAKRKTENQQRLPTTIGKWVDVGTKALQGVAQGVKLFAGGK